MEQLSGIDSAFFYAEDPNLPMHIATVTLYDPSTSPSGTVRLRDIMNLFERAVYNVPLFRQRLVEVPLGLDQPYWIDDPDFDIEYHIRHIALPEPGDWRQFYIQVARINSRALDRSRPLWEVYVIEGLNDLEGVPAGSFAVMMKLHYAALDDEALKSLFTSIHTATAEAPPEALDLSQPLKREIRSGALPLLLNASQNSLKRAFRLPGLLSSLLQGYRRIQKGEQTGEISKHPPIPRSIFNGELSPYRVVTSCSVPLETARRLRGAIDDATLNDLVLTVIGGALRLYLQDKGELPTASLVANAPVNLRDDKRHQITGDRLTANIPLCTNIKDPLERFFAVHEESVSARYYIKARGEDLPEQFTDSLHPIVTRNLLRFQENLEHWPLLSRLYPASPNTLLSNMPGPSGPAFLCGARVVTGLGLGPCLPDIGLFHTVASTAEQLVISVNACREMMGDPEFYRQCILRSWELTEAALEKELTAQPAGKTKSGVATKKPARKSPAKKKVAKKRSRAKPVEA